MQFRSKHGPIPDGHFDNEVAMKKDPYDCCSSGTKERFAKRLRDLMMRAVHRVSIE